MSQSRDLTEPAVVTEANDGVPAYADCATKDRLWGGGYCGKRSPPLVKQETRDALQTLLDRGARVPSKDNATKASGAGEASLQGAAAPNKAGAEERSVGGCLTSSSATDSAQAMPDPKLDQMFREIFESRTAPQANSTSAPASSVSTEAPTDERSAPQLESAPQMAMPTRSAPCLTVSASCTTGRPAKAQSISVVHLSLNCAGSIPQALSALSARANAPLLQRSGMRGSSPQAAMRSAARKKSCLCRCRSGLQALPARTPAYGRARRSCRSCPDA